MRDAGCQQRHLALHSIQWNPHSVTYNLLLGDCMGEASGYLSVGSPAKPKHSADPQALSGL